MKIYFIANSISDLTDMKIERSKGEHIPGHLRKEGIEAFHSQIKGMLKNCGVC